MSEEKFYDMETQFERPSTEDDSLFVDRAALQRLLASKVRVDRDHLSLDRTSGFLVGGIDISYSTICSSSTSPNAVVCVAAIDLWTLKLVASVCCECCVHEPYKSGYLAFREVGAIQMALEEYQSQHGKQYPIALYMIDGNGILHPRRCGIAVHVGVQHELATIGISKKLPQLDSAVSYSSWRPSSEANRSEVQYFHETTEAGEQRPLGIGIRDVISRRPIYISPGHKITPKSAMNFTLRCRKYRIPEPVRQADLISRAYIREHNI